MATILRRGNIGKCGYCNTEFSFELYEVGVGEKRIPAGYSPEEEEYSVPTYSVKCPSCRSPVGVENNVGADFKRDAKKHLVERQSYDDDI